MYAIVEKICCPKNEMVLPDVTKEATCVYEEDGSRWGKVRFCWGSIDRSYLLDSVSREVYNSDDALSIRIKCLALIPGTLMALVVRTIEDVAKSIIECRRPKSVAIAASSMLCLSSCAIGLVDPFEGRARFAFHERGGFDVYLAPCFQPLNCNNHDKIATMIALKARILRALRG